MSLNPDENGPMLVFLKLGGSLITDKNKPMTPRPMVIQRLTDEIASALRENPHLRLVIGHGSGSYGHAVASQYQTQSGGADKHFWQGFTHVWAAARALNQIVIQSLSDSGLPVIAFPPSAGIITHNQQIVGWDLNPIQHALTHELIPVVYGDVIFDQALGGTILSTEAVFQYLARKLQPKAILIAGLEPGVYRHYPIKPEPDLPDPYRHSHDEIITCITPENYNKILPGITRSQSVDVTGGMLSKVEMMISLIKNHPHMKVQILSGEKPMNLLRALSGETIGTLIATSEHVDQDG